MRGDRPVSRSHDAVRANYDRLSRWYDLLSGQAERRCLTLCLERLAARPGERVLEIGPGMGHGLVALAKSVGSLGRVYGVDLSAGMLSMARRRLTRAGALDRVALVRGDGASLPLRDGAFDALVMAFTLELFDSLEIPTVLAECRRVLAPGGRLGVVALAHAEHPSLMSRLYAWARRRWPQAIDCRPILLVSCLERAGFSPTYVGRAAIWGLPVTIAVAT